MCPAGENSAAMRLWKIIVIIILCSTALSKLLGLLHPALLLYQRDPVFGIPNYFIVGAATFVEFSLCVCIGFFFDDNPAAWSVFVFSMLLLAYRAIAAVHGVAYCPCLGNVVNWWPWLGRYENPILTSVLVWLLMTSVFQLLWRNQPA